MFVSKCLFNNMLERFGFHTSRIRKGPEKMVIRANMAKYGGVPKKRPTGARKAIYIYVYIYISKTNAVQGGSSKPELVVISSAGATCRLLSGAPSLSRLLASDHGKGLAWAGGSKTRGKAPEIDRRPQRDVSNLRGNNSMHANDPPL